MWGMLYVNDSEALRRPECQDLHYLVVAQEEQTQQEASKQIHVTLVGEGETVTAKVQDVQISNHQWVSDTFITNIKETAGVWPLP